MERCKSIPVPSYIVSSMVHLTLIHLRDFIKEEGQKLYFVNSSVMRLEDELEMMQMLLCEAEKIHHPSDSLRTYISRIRDCAFDAEDIVDKYRFLVKQKREDGFVNTIKLFNYVTYNLLPLIELHRDVTKLVDKIVHLSSQWYLFKFETIINQSLSFSNDTYHMFKSYSHIEDKGSIFTEVVEIVVEQLLLHQVINICGMGGLGKSTIAKTVFMKEVSQQNFKKFAWVYVSRDFETYTIVRAILRKLQCDNEEEVKKVSELQDDELLKRLDEILSNNKCLVVLDDLWRATDWHCLKSAFNSLQNSSSRVVVTTRKRDLLCRMGVDGFHCQLQCLDDATSWKFFQNKINQWRQVPSVEMLELAAEMVKKCGGLPLTINALSKILEVKTNIHEWRFVDRNLYWILNGGVMQVGPTISQVLELSYYDLPVYLQPCFLYLAGFPRGSKISFERLFHLWEIEGFLKSPMWNGVVIEEMTPKDIAMNHLKHLVNCNLVEVEERTRGGRIRTCSLHCMVWDLCVGKSLEANFLDMIVGGKQTSCRSARDVKYNKILQRLSIQLNKDEPLLDTILKIGSLRSLMCFSLEGYIYSDNFLRCLDIGSAVLRILDMEASYVRGLFPKAITNLRYLRLLSLKDTRFAELPSSIGNLKCLVILDLRVLHLENNVPFLLPNVLEKLVRLKHLYLPSCHYVCKDGSLLRLGGCSSLETLVGFEPRSCWIESLSVMDKLTKLSFNSYFDSITGLRILGLCPYAKSNRPFHISIPGWLLNEETKLLRRNLDYHLSSIGLHITGEITKSGWQSDIPRCLVSLMLHSCKLGTDPMSVLETFQSLRCLCLDACLNLEVKQLKFSEGGFPQLTTLVLTSLDWVEELMVEDKSMPNLVRVSIEHCRSLDQQQWGPRIHEIFKCPSSSSLYMKGSPTAMEFRKWVLKEPINQQ